MRIDSTGTKELTVIFEVNPDGEDGWFDLVSVNGKTPDQVKAEPTLTKQEGVEVRSAIKNQDPDLVGVMLDFSPKPTERLTDEQCLVELWEQVGTDAFWSHGDAPDMKGKPYIKLVGHITWTRYSSPDHGTEYDEEFEIDSQELLGEA